MAKCPKCGADVLDEATYCHKCGAKLQADNPDAQNYWRMNTGNTGNNGNNGRYVPFDGSGMNIFAVLGLVFSFVSPEIGLVLSIISLVQIKKRGQRGKGLALAGLIISIVMIVLSILYIVFHWDTYASLFNSYLGNLGLPGSPGVGSGSASATPTPGPGYYGA